MRAERFDFPNAQGHLLTGLLESPDAEPVAYALFAHCFTCSKESRAARRIAEGLAARGIAVLRFDFGPCPRVVDTGFVVMRLRAA